MHPYYTNQYSKDSPTGLPIASILQPHSTATSINTLSPILPTPSPSTMPSASINSMPAEESLGQHDYTHNQETWQKKRTKKDRACDLCRRKKIRCDYDLNNPQQSCKSCRGYGKTCTFNEAAKKRGPPKGYVENLENRLRRMEELLLNMAGSANLPAVDLDYPTRTGDSENDAEVEEAHHSTPETVNATHNNHATASRAACPISDTAFSGKRKDCQKWLDQTQDIVSSEKDGTAKRQKLDTTYSYTFEGNDDDLMVAFPRVIHSGTAPPYAHSAFNLPDKEVVDQLVEIYFKRMNVFLPIVDEADFYSKYQGNGQGTCVPLLAAICRSSCRLLDEDDWVVKKHKIDRGNLFKDLSRQLVEKFDFDFLQPNIETVQILLLVSASSEKWGVESVDWVGLGVAVKMAQDLGLHRKGNQWIQYKHNIEAHKRLWWSAYALDRWICAGLGRPMTISDADCDVELPSLETEEQRRISLFLVHLVKLSSVLGDILRLLCSPRARSLTENQPAMEKLCQGLEQTLTHWERNLPQQLSLSMDEKLAIENKTLGTDLENKLNNGAGQLYLAYYSVILLLKRPFISMGRSQSSTIEMPKECYAAIKSILATVECMRVKSLFSFSWSLSSYFISQGWVLNVLNLRNKDPKIVADTQKFLEIFTNQYLRLESYITESSVIPVLRVLAKMAADDTEDKQTSSLEAKSTTLKQDNTSEAQQSPPTLLPVQIPEGNQSTSESDPFLGETLPLLGASSGMNWQDLMLLLPDTGYKE